ncbi:MAG: SGNH/GDSL hydrolase family protein [Bacteroidota bacterium]
MQRRDVIRLLGIAGMSVFVPFHAIAKQSQNLCEVCKEAWHNLSNFNRKRYPFRYIEPTANLPKVLIYGDSISIGYTEYIRASLASKADVFRIHENGGASGAFISYMEALKNAMFEPHLPGGWNFKWDVIHFNVGLHDLKYLNEDRKLDKENGRQVSSIKTYKKNLEKIIGYLKETYPTAKLIFATTTPIPEGANGRYAKDSIRFNKAAHQVLRKHKDIQVNDLFTFTKNKVKNLNQAPSDVHYKPEGSRLQGIESAKYIANALGITPVECPSSDEIQEKFKSYKAK